eukprot:3059551-Pyramimonas_sp.AAC.1
MGPATLRVLLAVQGVDDQWLGMIRMDLEWLSSMAVKGDQWSLEQWVLFIRNEPRKYLNMCSTAWVRYSDIYHDCCQKQVWKELMIAVNQTENGEPVERQGYICYECGEVLFSQRAWRMHRTKEHGGLTDARLYAESGYCYGCDTNFHTRKRLLYHLKYRETGCLDFMRLT